MYKKKLFISISIKNCYEGEILNMIPIADKKHIHYYDNVDYKIIGKISGYYCDLCHYTININYA